MFLDRPEIYKVIVRRTENIDENRRWLLVALSRYRELYAIRLGGDVAKSSRGDEDKSLTPLHTFERTTPIAIRHLAHKLTIRAVGEEMRHHFARLSHRKERLSNQCGLSITSTQPWSSRG